MSHPKLSISVEGITYCESKVISSEGKSKVNIRFSVQGLDDTEAVPLRVVMWSSETGKYDASKHITESRAKLAERFKALAMILEDDEGEWEGLC